MITRKKKAVFLLIYMLLVLALLYFTTVFYRSFKLFDYLAANRNIMTAGVVEADARLGFAPKAGSHGWLRCPSPPDVPYFYDAFRFRIPEGQTDRTLKRPYILSLGCSFTHGDACNAEDTFSFIVARELNGTALNAGFWGYGLAQMLILARQYVSEYQPEYILAQYAPWLVERSSTPFPPTRFGKRTTPYFYEDENGQIQLHEPLKPLGKSNLESGLYSSFPLENYRGVSKTPGNFIRFYREIGYPLFVKHSDALVASYAMGRLTGEVPAPTTNRLAVVKYVYEQLAGLCASNNVTLVIPVLGAPEKEMVPYELEYIMSITNAIVIDTYTPIRKTLPDGEKETFLRAYAHYRGDPPVMIDGHPNAKAHAFYANEILKSLSAQPDHKSR